MTDWDNASPTQLSVVQDALLHAFPNPEDFEMLLALNLGQDYVQIVDANVNYRVGVFQILRAAQANQWLNDLVNAARQKRPRNRVLAAITPLAAIADVPPKGGRSLEAMVRSAEGFEDFVPWLQRLDRLRGQVCRIESPVNTAAGTGWLVASDLLLTNYHVVDHVLNGDAEPSSIVCRFDYASDNNQTNPGATYALATEWCPSHSPASASELGSGEQEPTGDHLDYALLRLAEPVGDQAGPSGQPRGWIATKRGTAMPATGTIVFVLQHPSGLPLKLAVGEIIGAGASNVRLLHNANTLTGSSGSPCLNVKLELVALHNAGDPLYDGVVGAPTQNQAIPLAPILANIEAKAPSVARFWAA